MDQKEKKSWLEEEVRDWKNEGIINEDQAQQILSRSGLGKIPLESEKITTEREEDIPSRLIAIISILGAILIGAGVILFVASNWEKIPQFIRLILVFGLTYAIYFTGWRLEYDTKSHPRVGHALIFLASIFVGVMIFLTAQIFHVNANEHWLILLWFLAILPFGYAFNSRPILGLNFFTFVLWMFEYINSLRGVGGSEVFMLYLLFGITLYGSGQLHTRIEKYSHFRLFYQGVGLFFILFSYFIFNLNEDPGEFILGDIVTNDFVFLSLFFVFSLTSLASIFGSVYGFDKLKTVKHEFYILLIAFLGWACILFLNLMGETLITTTTTRYGRTYTTMEPGVATILFVAYYLIFFTLSIGSTLIGYRKNISSFVNLGLVFFVLGVMHLYFTRIFELLPRSLAFIIGGIALLGGGWYLENKRRSLLKDMAKREEG
ncbi:MAG: DUF2157 domain-containing protein [Halobacteriota archaeon]|nr:DUF2157 domain-containing protein [Halobacteriota archaeon]